MSSTTPEQKAKENLITGFACLLEQSDHIDPARLLALADSKEHYPPACLEVYQRRSDLFMQEFKEGNSEQNQPKIEDRAKPYLSWAVEAKYAPACYVLARTLLRKRVPISTPLSSAVLPYEAKGKQQVASETLALRAEAQAQLEEGAKQGYAPAQLELANYLLINLGAIKSKSLLSVGRINVEERKAEDLSIEKQLEKIITLLKAAAGGGSLSALCELGKIYSGLVPPELKKGLKGLVFFEIINETEAVKYYLAAAKRGHRKSIEALYELSRLPWSDESDNLDVYYKALKQLAKEGYVEAEHRLGEIYRAAEGQQVSHDHPSQLRLAIQADQQKGEESAKWLERAAGHGRSREGDSLSQFQAPTDGTSISAPLVTEWDESHWLKNYDSNWRKQKYDPQFLAGVDNHRSSTLKVDQKEDDQESGLAPYSYTSSRTAYSCAAPTPLTEESNPKLPLIKLSIALILGIGLSMLILYFSGALLKLAALGLGAVAPFFLAGAVGGLLALTLVASLQLSFKAGNQNLLNALFILAPLSLSGLALLLAMAVFASTGPVALAVAGVLGAGLGLALPLLLRWKNPISAAPGGSDKPRPGKGASGIDLDGRLEPERGLSVGAPSPADKGPVSRGRGGDDVPGSSLTLIKV